MKKLVVTTLVGLAASVCCFAQGNFTFNNGSGTWVWDSYSGAPIKAGATLEVAVMWAGISNAIPTNFRSGAASPTNGVSADWTGIFTDPNFQLAHETTGGNPVIVSTAGGTGPQAGIYLGGLHYIQGSTVGQTVSLYVIAWAKSYGIDPIAAAAAGAPLGVSQVIPFTLGSSAAPAGSLGNNIPPIGQFGVALVPEPTTFALLGLGTAGLLIFRRRK